MTKSPKVSYEEKIMKEFEEATKVRLAGVIIALTMSLMLGKKEIDTSITDAFIKGNNALFKDKLVQVRKDTLEGLEREVKLLKTGLVDAQDDTVDEVLSLISGMKGGKE